MLYKVTFISAFQLVFGTFTLVPPWLACTTFSAVEAPLNGPRTITVFSLEKTLYLLCDGAHLRLHKAACDGAVKSPRRRQLPTEFTSTVGETHRRPHAVSPTLLPFYLDVDQNLEGR